MLRPARFHACSRRRAALLASTLALASLVVGLLSGFPAGSAGAADPSPLRIRMFGDSVMLGAHDDLLAAFPGADVNVDALESRSLLGTTPVLAAHPELLGDVVVLDLGYNDMGDPGVFRERIDAMMQALATTPRVVWLTQAVFQPVRSAMNDELRAAASRHANLDVVSWDAQVSAHPEFVYADGLHLTPPGRAAFASTVQQEVDAYRRELTHPNSTQAAPTTAAPVSVAGTRVQAQSGDRRAESRVERQAAASASSPTAGPTGRAIAAVAIGMVALVVLAGVVLLRRSHTGSARTEAKERTGTAAPSAGQRMRQRPVPSHRSHSGAPPLA
ncbi:MAG: hypothetical protein U0W40_11675 [Acidimicrobiia bacterium]